KGPGQNPTLISKRIRLSGEVISTSKDFHDTRAHWYYRFKSPRILSKLLIFDPQDFNLCTLQSSYSYSVMSGRSGIQDSQTSFVGCDHGKCCACFGPDKTWRVENGIRRKGPCSVPEDVTINDGVANEIKDVIGKLDSFKQEINNKLTTVNSKSEKKIKDVTGKFDNKLTTVNKDVKDNKALIQKWMTRSEKKINDVSGKLNSFKQEINNKLTTVNKVLTHKSCKQIWMSRRNNGDGVYRISVKNSQVMDVYCQMTNVSGCKGGGWTMVMKINGSLSTFKYTSSYWTNKVIYHDYAYGRNGGLDNRQFKGSTYWRTSFKEICVGMKYGSRLRAFSFSYPASSLHSLIADGNYRQTRLGRAQWKSLISGSSLQRNCNQEGFNVDRLTKSLIVKVRLGIIANKENGCASPDSFVGLGAEGGVNYPKGWTWCRSSYTSANAAGNLAQCGADNGNKNARAMAYILVR
ncbi:Hypothetical predicted protein, partial [Paramuricea clavata]